MGCQDHWLYFDSKRFKDLVLSLLQAGKEVDIGLDGGRDKPLCLTDMLLYSLDGGLDLCVDLTCSSPLTQTGLANFAPHNAVSDAAHRKWVKYEVKCGDIEAHAAILIYNRINFAISKRVGAHIVSWLPTNFHVFESAQRSFDVALRSSLERIVTASGPGFGDWQWRLATLPFAFGGSMFISQHAGIGGSWASFEDALYIYFTKATKSVESTFSLSPRQMAVWESQLGDHTCDWLRAVPISGLGQTMKACSRVFIGDINGEHAISYAGIIGIKHRHNVVRDTLVDICYQSGISSGKEVDIGLDGGRDKPLLPIDILLYSWDRGLDVCVDLTGSSPLTQTGMINFVFGRAVIDAAHRKRVKYETKCEAIGYEFLLFSFLSLGELEEDAVTLFKRIRKFSMTQDIGARVALHIFNRIGFAITKRVRAQIVSRLLTNFM
ncbi:hypothetical protein Tco_0687087 [Tanacetum coccineum]